MMNIDENGFPGRRTFLKGALPVLGAGMALSGQPEKSFAQGTKKDSKRDPVKPASLRVTHIEQFRVQVPARAGSVSSVEFTPDGLSQFWEGYKCFIKVYGDNGITGIGETGREYSQKSVDENIAWLTGKDVHSLDFAHMSLGMPGTDTSIAFEMAIFDLIGKTWGVPVHRLLGGKCQDRVAVTFWTGRRNPHDMEESARRCVDLGYKSLKFKGRPGDPVLEEFRAIDRVSHDIEITVDYNQTLKTPEEYLQIAPTLQDFNIKAVEDPLPFDMVNYARIREKTKPPIAMTLFTPSQVIYAIKIGACNCFNFGGDMRAFVRICAVAEAAGMTAWHGSGIELGVMDTSYIHAISATRSCTIASDVLGYLIREYDFLTTPIRVEDGYAVVPDTPGLGVELDEDALKKYRI